MNNLSQKFLLILYGDINFDGRAKRMAEIARTLGSLYIIDASTRPQKESPLGENHSRVTLNANWSLARKHLTFWYHIFKIIYSNNKPTVILAENFFVTLPSLILARLLGSKLVYDAYELIILDKNSKPSFRDKFWYRLEKFTAPRADLIIAANPERADCMQSHYVLQKTPTYMRNIPSAITGNQRNQLEILDIYPILKKQNLLDKFVLYQGDISLNRGIGRFIECINNLPENYKLILAGDGPDLEKIKSLYEEHIVTGRLIILGRVRNDILPQVTIQADVGIVTYPYHGINNIYCAPNKLFEYAQAGVPVIATSQIPISNIVNKFNTGITISKNSTSSEIKTAIIKLADNRIQYTKNIAMLVKNYQWNNEFNRVCNEINLLLKKG